MEGVRDGRIPVFRKREIYYLAKLSSEPGARGATAEGESENTSTSSPPEEAGGPTGAGGAAPRPRRSADGEGVDWKTGKERVNEEASGHRPAKGKCPRPSHRRGARWVGLCEVQEERAAAPRVKPEGHHTGKVSHNLTWLEK